MLKATVKQGANATIEATGNIGEIVTDIARLINAIHTQIKAADSKAADTFRLAIGTVVNSQDSFIWEHTGDQQGIFIYTQKKEEP